MKLIYIGPLEAVEVPHDLVPDGAYIAERNGEPVDFPDDIAEGLLAQGQDSAEDDPQHQPQWKKADGEPSLQQKIKRAKAKDLDAIASALGYEFAGGVTKVADKKAALLDHVAAAATDEPAQADGDDA